uniref:Uncharacterized protein n=1 Tax=Arundo donax TaxID=35708 RepID=A0A0A9C971_ARUDO
METIVSGSTSVLVLSVSIYLDSDAMQVKLMDIRA